MPEESKIEKETKEEDVKNKILSSNTLEVETRLMLSDDIISDYGKVIYKDKPAILGSINLTYPDGTIILLALKNTLSFKYSITRNHDYFYAFMPSGKRRAVRTSSMEYNKRLFSDLHYLNIKEIIFKLKNKNISYLTNLDFYQHLGIARCLRFFNQIQIKKDASPDLIHCVRRIANSISYDANHCSRILPSKHAVLPSLYLQAEENIQSIRNIKYMIINVDDSIRMAKIKRDIMVQQEQSFLIIKNSHSYCQAVLNLESDKKLNNIFTVCVKNADNVCICQHTKKPVKIQFFENHSLTYNYGDLVKQLKNIYNDYKTFLLIIDCFVKSLFGIQYNSQNKDLIKVNKYDINRLKMIVSLSQMLANNSGNTLFGYYLTYALDKLSDMSKILKYFNAKLI